MGIGQKGGQAGKNNRKGYTEWLVEKLPTDHLSFTGGGALFVGEWLDDSCTVVSAATPLELFEALDEFGDPFECKICHYGSGWGLDLNHPDHGGVILSEVLLCLQGGIPNPSTPIFKPEHVEALLKGIDGPAEDVAKEGDDNTKLGADDKPIRLDGMWCYKCGAWTDHAAAYCKGESDAN